jgi:PTS system nitrogen regulatory IIA component
MCNVAYFDPGSVIWDLQSSNKFDAIREVIYKAEIFTQHKKLDLDTFAAKVLERERQQSTGFGHGVAVAHGRTPQVSSPHIALGVSRTGIDFDAMDGQPVHLLFIVANHPDHSVDYLHILSTLVGMVRDEMFRREILTCNHVADVQRKLCRVFSSLLEEKGLEFAC